jgi:hypothetical protein
MSVTRSLLLGIVFIVGCAVGGVSSHFAAAPARAGTNPERWEHCCFRGTEGITETADKLGAEGWEMAAAAGAGSGLGYGKEIQFIFCFKRPRG